MRYEHIAAAVFRERPNRFLARVLLDGRPETVHVNNTGRCAELLVPGAAVYLNESGTPGRKTRYDLVAVRRADGVLFNIDSQAPNRVVREWLETRGFDRIVPEYRRGDSRLDFRMDRGDKTWLMEVKGCTLDVGGIGYFPDAPTERGLRHLRELARAAAEGYRAALAFVIQMEGVTEVRPNDRTQPAFGEALAEARRAGVRVLHLPCRVTPDSLMIRETYTESW